LFCEGEVAVELAAEAADEVTGGVACRQQSNTSIKQHTKQRVNVAAHERTNERTN
jgi:hypothetical protein